MSSSVVPSPVLWLERETKDCFPILHIGLVPQGWIQSNVDSIKTLLREVRCDSLLVGARMRGLLLSSRVQTWKQILRDFLILGIAPCYVELMSTSVRRSKLICFQCIFSVVFPAVYILFRLQLK